MEAHLPTEWSTLCLLVFMLGMRHGLDADHLATIDGLTRFNSRSNPGLARWCGCWFSLGHGAVVVAIALAPPGLGGGNPGWHFHRGQCLGCLAGCQAAGE